MNYSIIVTNIKCGGCANSITKNLNKKLNLESINVDIEKGEISWNSDNPGSKKMVKDTLEKMGYPESNPTLIQTAKSYVSCAIGRMK